MPQIQKSFQNPHMVMFVPPGVVEVDAVAEEGRRPDAGAHPQRPARQRGRRQRRQSHLVVVHSPPRISNCQSRKMRKKICEKFSLALSLNNSFVSEVGKVL